MASDVIGRDAELATLEAFLDSVAAVPGALVLRGEPGMGKTTLWEAGVGAARERGYRVLSARPSEAEGDLSHAALADILETVEPEQFATLPGPQRQALDVALLRAAPSGPAPEPRAIAAGVLGVLRGLAADGPVLVAIDDVHWLDGPSAGALTFAARRLNGYAVRFLVTERSTSTSALSRALEQRGLERIAVGAFSLGATRHLLSQQLGLSLPRPSLRRIVESTRGNPLFALEVGRMVVDLDLRGVEELPVPERVEDLIGIRVAALAAPVRRALIAVALSPDLRPAQLATIVEPSVVEETVRAGLLLDEGDHLRAFHPLLAAAASQQARPAEIREIHQALARAMLDEPRWARHLALATSEPDSAVAATVATAASTAASRGAADGAVELAEHALRLTPARSPERTDRLLALAEYLMRTGQPQRVTELLVPVIDHLPAGRARARAHLIMAEESRMSGSHVDAWGDHLDRAFAESAGDPALHALVTARRVRYMAVVRVERLRDAEAMGVEALPSARAAGPEVEREALYGLGWARYLRGRPVDDLRERFHAASSDAFQIFRSLEPLEAERLAGRGDVGGARAMFERLLAQADERGEQWSYVRLRLGLCELELRAGEWDRAAHLLEEWVQSPDGELLTAPAYDRCQALLAVGRGRPEEALPWAAHAIAESDASGLRWDWLEALRVHGTASLLGNDPGQAAASLRSAWAYMDQQGVEDPSVFPVAPELVEALTELGETNEARVATDRLAEMAAHQGHPWALVTASRCRAMVDLASHAGDEEARSTLATAAAAYDRFGLPFDGARSLLVLGRAERRLRQWGAARRSLEAAVAAFEGIGSPGWAEQARSELDRVGARRPAAPGTLTSAEERVVKLAAEGLSNKEIARVHASSVHTVEVQLSHAYAKLGVQSRAQLARRLAAETTR